MGSKLPQVLGDFFAHCEFPQDQKLRIAAAATVRDHVCGRAFQTYAARTESYLKGFEKHERIAGARVGTKFYRARALDRIAEWLADDNRRGWSIYREAAVLHMEKELAALNMLLAEVPVPPGAFTVSDALHTVCSRASEFEVSKDHILQFYELWGNERVTNFETVVNEWMKPDEAAQQRRQIAALLKEVDALKKVVGDLVPETSALKEAVKTAQQEVEDSRAVQKTVGDAQRRCGETVSRLMDRADLSDQKLQDLAHDTKVIEDRIDHDTVSISALKTEAEQLEASVSAALASSVNATRSALETLLRSDLDAVERALESRLSELAGTLSRVLEGQGRAGGLSRYRSPLARVPSCPGPQPTISEELVFVNSFMRRLVTEYELDVGFEVALAYHRGFLANRVVVADWTYVKAWLDCLEWQAFSVQLVASPTWSGEEHWAEGAEHLFEPGTSPRFTVIHNYDVALVDYYLSPSVSLWCRQHQPAGAFAKLFLIPSGGEAERTPLLTEHAFVCAADPVGTGRPLILRDALLHTSSPAGEPASGVEPAAMLSWLQASEPPPVALHAEVARIATMLGCTFSRTLMANVRSTGAYSSKYFAEVSAINFAIDSHVAPWIHSKFGGERDGELRALLTPLSSAAM